MKNAMDKYDVAPYDPHQSSPGKMRVSHSTKNPNYFV